MVSDRHPPTDTAKLRDPVRLTKLDVKIQVDATPRTSWQIHHAVRKHFESNCYLFDFTHDSVKRLLSVLVYRGEIQSLYTTCSDGEKGTVYWR